ncbi:putative hydrolase of the HAD superfamily [Paenibacillus sp. UNCCL117]|nr:putative hydrolase of the HAD superfamily [Paenibacillus sp. cl123]SFW16291.1 putative hydrolase of the HAD superfamily [Paenibacillus sp. UNCCL117]
MTVNESKPLSGKQVIFFDVNQTLVLQGLSFEACFREVWSAYAARWDSAETGESDKLWEAYITRWHQRKKARSTFKQLDELQQQCLREAFLERRLPVSGSMARDFMQEVLHLQVSAKTMPPRTHDTLTLLMPRFTLAIISNSPRAEVLLLLERFGLQSFFPAERVYTALRPADKKPSPVLFKSALHALKLAPRHAVMVGNSWRHDVCGAVKVGMDAVWLHESGDPVSESPKITRQKLGKRQVYLIKRIDQLPGLFS